MGEAPVREAVSLEAEALGRAEAAQRRLADVDRRIADFKLRHFQSGAGVLVCVGGVSRVEVEAELHGLADERYQALTEFNARLAEWARLKTGDGATNLNPPCPACGSACVVALAGRLHCNNCASDFCAPRPPDPPRQDGTGPSCCGEPVRTVAGGIRRCSQCGKQG